VNALVRRASRVSEPTSLSAGELKLDLLSRKVERAGQTIELQAREFALLAYLLRNAGRVVTKTMLLSHIWDYSFDPQTNVVDVLVCRVRYKVDKKFDRKLIRTVRGMGSVLDTAWQTVEIPAAPGLREPANGTQAFSLCGHRAFSPVWLSARKPPG